jgi:hypothetical protein
MAGAKRNDAVATAPAAKARRLSLRAMENLPVSWNLTPSRSQ